MSEIEILSLNATEGYIFAGDNERCASFVDRKLRDELARILAAQDTTLTGSQPATWALYNGKLVFSATRTVRIVYVTASAHELHVMVDGTSEDASDVLREVWHHMNVLASTPAPELASLAQTPASQTRAVVRLPFEATALFPLLGIVEDALRNGSPAPIVETAGHMPFRFSVPIRLLVGQLLVDRELAIEPRFTAKLSDRIYFTASPLGSVEHLAMLEKIVHATTSK